MKCDEYIGLNAIIHFSKVTMVLTLMDLGSFMHKHIQKNINIIFNKRLIIDLKQTTFVLNHRKIGILFLTKMISR